MSEAESAPEVRPGGVRTLPGGAMVGAAQCPVCQETPLQGRQTVCSAACRRTRSRQREADARDARDREVRALLEAALRKLGGAP